MVSCILVQRPVGPEAGYVVRLINLTALDQTCDNFFLDNSCK